MVFFRVFFLTLLAVLHDVAASVAEVETAEPAAVIFAGANPGIVAAADGALAEFLPPLVSVSARRRPPPAAAVLGAVIAPPCRLRRGPTPASARRR